MKRNSRLFVFILIFFSNFSRLSAGEDLPYIDAKALISMDFQDASLKDILKIFSIQSGLNLIASQDVEDRKITLYLNNVPVKETMDNLFKANNLIYKWDKEANIITVKKAQAETVTRVYYLKYATVDSSSLTKEASGGQSTGSVSSTSTSTGTSAKTIITAIGDVLTKQNGKITENTRTNSLIITDNPDNFPAIEQVISRLDVPVPSVLIEVEMLDVSKNVVDALGFKFDTNNPITLLLPNARFNDTAKFFLGNIAYRGADTLNTANQGVLSWGNLYALVLDFLRTQTDTKYLARPRLLTLNNETAEISITRDEVVGKVETPGTQTSAPTVNYIRSTDLSLTKEGTGIFLRVTPQINLETNEITMVVNPKSSITTTSSISSSQSDAEIRSTKSIVKVKDGETVILGGLLHTDRTVSLKKIPILGDIPFVGAFFRHKDQTKDLERELLVFLTPHIIKDTITAGGYLKKAVLPVREQDIYSMYDGRQSAIDTALNSLDKIR